MVKIDWPGIDEKIGEGVDHGIHLHPDFFSDLENYNKGGGNQMNNEIEDSVDIRAKLEQLTEECGELIQASMKLIRALGNGNPTRVSKDEAIAKVLEEWSDVEIAGIYILRMLEDMADYDIYEKIEEIGKFKEQRWIDRVRKGDASDEDVNGESVSGSSCTDGDFCNL